MRRGFCLRPWHTLFVAILALGCFRDPDLSKVRCSTSDCPTGLACVNGMCVRSTDGGPTPDGTQPVSEDAPRVDGAETGAVDLSRADRVDRATVDLAGSGDGANPDVPIDQGPTVTMDAAEVALPDSPAQGGAGGGGLGGGDLLGNGGIGGATAWDANGMRGDASDVASADGADVPIATGGTGGAAGNGGTIASGGVVSSGGLTGTGGTAASGGTVATGGMIASGGVPGTGGTIGAGGATGGTVVSGGIPGTGGTAGTGTGGSTAHPGDITVDQTNTHQIVDGFGFADVWQDSSSTATQTLLFDPVNGIGLTLLRIGIDGTTGAPNIMGAAGYADGQACVQYAGSDCKVWATPWSPPASMKDNNNLDNGGHLLVADYASWAAILAAFPAFYKQNGGVDLYAISAQEEPDFPASYQSCLFSSSQMVDWINVLGPALAALTPPVKVIAPEPDTWGDLWGVAGYGPAILADSTASSYVGPIATHDYVTTSVGKYARPAPPANNAHHIWETECVPTDTGPITIATMIYAAFSTGGVNAWHYWWTPSLVPDTSNPPPQVYALGNFSNFVRPGYYRADVTGAPTPSASAPLVVAFTNPADGKLAIVVVNGGGSQNVSFFVAGTAWPASVTPYVTTSSSKLAAGTAIAVTAGRFSATLAAQSVTTFVGEP